MFPEEDITRINTNIKTFLYLETRSNNIVI